MGQTLDSAPLIPCPLLGLHGGWGAGSLNNLPLIMASSYISESLSTPVRQNMDEESTTENCHYDRWLVVESVDRDHSVSKLSPFILDKAICSAVGRMKTVRLLRNGHLLLEVASAVQSRIVNKLDNLCTRFLFTDAGSYTEPCTPIMSWCFSHLSIL